MPFSDLSVFGVSLVMFMLGWPHLGAARTGAYFSLAPFIGAALAMAIIRDGLTAQFLEAGLLMGVGIWLHVSERHGHEHVHTMLEHDHAHSHDAHHQHAHNGNVNEQHSRTHRHEQLRQSHRHFPDVHYRHRHC